MKQNDEKELYIKLESSLYESGLPLKKFSIGRKEENAICMCFKIDKDIKSYNIFSYENNITFDEIIMDDKESAFHYFAYKITSSSQDKEKVKKILLDTFLIDQMEKAYYIIIKSTNQMLEDYGYYKTCRNYERFLIKIIFEDIDSKLEKLDYEYKDLDLYYREVLNDYKFIFYDLLNKIICYKINIKLIKILIPSIILVYFSYLEDNKKYNIISKKIKNNELVKKYKSDKIETLKDFVNNKLTIR